jgi:NadR type nicotinamide-nucleotide adenylyltransferase
MKVVLTGSECTGKTTLAAALARRFHTNWAPEFAREYVDQVGRALGAGDVEPIARGQMAGEDGAVERASRLVFLDTDLVSTVVYSRHYYGSCPPWIEAAARQRHGDLYLLHHPDVPWREDGRTRDRPELRDEVHALFEETLRSLQARVVPITGTFPEREARAVAAVEALS